MSKKNRMFTFLFIITSVLFVFTFMIQPAPGAQASAAPVSGPCFQLYLPMIIGGAETSAKAARQAKDALVPDVPPASCSESGVHPDFNNDGFADLAIGVPDEDVTQGLTYDNAGAVHVIYGSGDGLVALAAQAVIDDQLWHRGVDGLDQIAVNTDDDFGSALGYGDFNKDGYDDLAIGIPGSLVGPQDGAGAVQILYGSADGLTVTGSQSWSQGSDNIDGVPEAGDNFGASLTGGDFNDDGYADLAIGAPREDVKNPNDDAGAINILYGSAEGLRAFGDDILTQDVVGFPASSAEQDDEFGTTLTTGDFNGDGIDDLAVGTPYEDNGAGFDSAGAVQIFFGSANSGLVHPTDGVINPQHIRADSPGVDNAMEAFDQFGYALAAADFNKDGYDDLAVGVPFETHGSGPGSIPYAGAVNIIYGSASGLDTTLGAPIFHQGLPDMESEPNAMEYFGFSLTTADFDNDGYGDLAVGVPGDKIFGTAIGSAHVLYGAAGGLTTEFDKIIYDGANPELSDDFGFAVTSADFNGDGYAELAVGAPNDDPIDLPVDNVGSVFVYYSDEAGVSQPNYQNWYQGHNGVAGAPELGDHFGQELP